FLSITRRPPRPHLFPYTTLFRSGGLHTCTPCARPRSTSPSRRTATHMNDQANSTANDSTPLPCTTTGYGLSRVSRVPGSTRRPRSEEHTSELQSRENLVCRLLLE